MIEEIAAVQHEIWSHWMKYLFQCSFQFEKFKDGSALIPADKVKRWKRQMNTPYSELTEKEKESDRDQAQKVIRVLK